MKEGFETYTGDGFRFSIPKVFGKKIEADKAGRWEYGEFLYISSPGSEQRSPTVEGFFYYWTKERIRFEFKTLRKQCRKIVAEFFFEPGFRLFLRDYSPTEFMDYQALKIKFRYTVQNPVARGPLNFYIADNTNQQKIYYVGLVTEQGGDYIQEKEVMLHLKDTILTSFHFTY